MCRKLSLSQVIVILAIGTLVVLLVASCKKNTGTPHIAAPVIHSFTPSAAAKDSLIVISGDNFHSFATENKVTINGVAAEVITGTSTSLSVKVPRHAGDGKIVVQTSDKTATSATDFSYIFTAGTLAGGEYGYKDDHDSLARFAAAFGITKDAEGNIIVADGGNNRIRKITPGGTVSTIAGDGSIGTRNGAAGQAQFNYPRGVATDAAGNIYVADAGNNMIRKITAAGIVSTVAGDGTEGFKDDQDIKAKFHFPVELVLDKAGNIYVTDGTNARIRKITPAGWVSTIQNTQLGFPEGIAIDKAGNLYVADAALHRIYKISAAGVFSTVAGTGTPGYSDGPGTTAQFINPEGLAIDAAGNLYVGDLSNAVVRKITPSGVVSTLIGSTRGFAEGPGAKARFLEPSGITVDAAGNIYLADVGNSRIRRIQ